MIEVYSSPSGMTWCGKPTKTIKLSDGVLAFFNNPINLKRSDCIIEIWKKQPKTFLGITYQSEVNVVGVFRVKNKVK